MLPTKTGNCKVYLYCHIYWKPEYNESWDWEKHNYRNFTDMIYKSEPHHAINCLFWFLSPVIKIKFHTILGIDIYRFVRATAVFLHIDNHKIHHGYYLIWLSSTKIVVISLIGVVLFLSAILLSLSSFLPSISIASSRR